MTEKINLGPLLPGHQLRIQPKGTVNSGGAGGELTADRGRSHSLV